MKTKTVLSKMSIFAAYIQLCAFIGLILSVMAWPFWGWAFTWKIGLTSLVCIVLFAMVYNGLNRHLKAMKP